MNPAPAPERESPGSPDRPTLLAEFESWFEARLEAMEPAVRRMAAEPSVRARLRWELMEEFLAGRPAGAPPAPGPGSLGDRLRAARRLRGMSAAELASALGLTRGQQYVSRAELGRIPNISVAQVARLAHALHTDPGWLAFGTGAAPEPAGTPAPRRRRQPGAVAGKPAAEP